MSKMILENKKFEDYTIDVYLKKYPGGTNCLDSLYFDNETGGWLPFAHFTINIPDLAPDEVAIKTFSEGADFLPWLFSWDVVGHPVKVIIGDHNVRIPICKLLIK